LYLTHKFRAVPLQFGNNRFNIFNSKGNMTDIPSVFAKEGCMPFSSVGE
jgi:hypothetical protein